MQSKKRTNTNGDLILGFPVSRSADAEPGGSIRLERDRPRFYDLDESIINRKPGQRTIMPAVGGEQILYDGDGHLMTIAPTGSGKGRSVIIPNLLHFEGPVIVVDPKGENFKVTARRRREMGQAVYVLDPFRVMVDKSDCLNPLDIFDLSNADVETDAQMIAELLSGDSFSAREPFWDISGRGLYSGLITFIADPDPEGAKKYARNLSSIKRILMGDDAVYELAKALDESATAKKGGQRGINEVAQLEIASFLQLADVTRTGILATANSYTKAFTSARVSETLDSSSFSLNDIVEGTPITIYIIVPPDKLKSHKALLKLWIGTLLKAISSRRVIPQQRTLFILDECGQLGTFQFLETAITLLRGYGLQTWSFWQDLSQLKKLYEIEWSTMVNNCAVIQIFGTNNFRVASEFADMVGVAADQVSAVRSSDQILMIGGEKLLRSKRLDYLKNERFKGLWDQNPFYASVPAR